ncbi:MAG: ribose ABC transporter [Devosia sp.]|jgi:L-fucose mutarotase|uniref:RbsD/FucU family protein n=1 Tax=unclassified Devosia TaxID=196773 RepID=UPI001A002ED0|nr:MULTISPECIES: RbsD/FucU domain-containing protein [unclassified Devosia]MBF0679466.1 ribose ABC transporter [Devosia sp.]WEJ33796.1 ribose ABC transporter [Devosia sp. SD17-2]
MLKNIPALLGPDLLYALRAMGHGDEIAIVDANFPAEYLGPEVMRLDGISATEVLNAVLTVMPLDEFVDVAAFGMAVVGEPDRREPIYALFEEIITRHEPGQSFSRLERFAFYEKTRSCAAIVQTGETRLYGNIILKKGIIRPAD